MGNVMHCRALYFTSLHNIVLNCTILLNPLYITVLALHCCTSLHNTVLHCTVSLSSLHYRVNVSFTWISNGPVPKLEAGQLIKIFPIPTYVYYFLPPSLSWLWSFAVKQQKKDASLLLGPPSPIVSTILPLNSMWYWKVILQRRRN